MAFDEKDYLVFLEINQDHAKNTIKQYKLRVFAFFRWLGDKELNKESVQQFLSYLKNEKHLKPSTLNTYLHGLSSLRDYFKFKGKDSNFLDGFKAFRKNKTDVEVLSLEQIKAILDTHLEYGNYQGKNCSALDSRYLAFTLFLTLTACRFEEGAGLKVKNVDISSRRVKFVDTKTNEDRNEPLFEPLLSILTEIIKDKDLEDLVFTNMVNNKFSNQEYSKDLKERALKAGIPANKRVYPHIFRHSYASELVKKHVSMAYVAKLLGHKDIQTTYEYYARFEDDDLEKAAMRHPLISQNLDPKEIIMQLKAYIDNFRQIDNKRLLITTSDSDKEYSFSIKVK